VSITLHRTWKVEGVLTDATSVTLQDPTNTYGVKRNDTNAAVLSAGTVMTHTATGTYDKSFDEPAAGLTYTAYIKVVYDGETYYFEVDVTGTTSTDAILTAAEVQTELGITTPTAIETSVIAAAILSAPVPFADTCNSIRSTSSTPNTIHRPHIEWRSHGESGNRQPRKRFCATWHRKLPATCN